MTDRPIILNGQTVRSIMDGRQTMMRRVLKPPYGVFENTADGKLIPVCLQCGPGDRLWVRETWGTVHMRELFSGPKPPFEQMVYRAGRRVLHMKDAPPDYDIAQWPVSWGDDFPPDDGRWRPSIHMPRWASRLTLIVTDVRVERLQEITRDDAIAEGLILCSERDNLWCWSSPAAKADNWLSPTECYRDLWDSLNAKRPGCAWSDNPWVAAITFDTHQQNIDAMDGAV